MSTLARRVLLSREKADLSQKEVAEAVGIKQPSYHKIESGQTKKTKFISELAKVFGVDVNWLATGEGSLNNSPLVKVKFRNVPILNYVQAGEWRRYFDDAIADHFEPVSGNFGEHSYGLVIEGDSMNPRFNDGDIIIVDPDKQAKSGSHVVAMVNNNDGNSVTFKKYRPRGFYEQGKEYFELVALNDDYPSYDSRFVDCEIVGVAVRHIEELS